MQANCFLNSAQRVIVRCADKRYYQMSEAESQAWIADFLREVAGAGHPVRHLKDGKVHDVGDRGEKGQGGADEVHFVAPPSRNLTGSLPYSPRCFTNSVAMYLIEPYEVGKQRYSQQPSGCGDTEWREEGNSLQPTGCEDTSLSTSLSDQRS